MLKIYDKPVVVSPSFEILSEKLSLAERIELCGRVCYKSEKKITEDSAIGFCRGMAGHKHNSVLEMGNVSLFVTKAGNTIFLKDYFYNLDRKYLVVDEWEGGILVTGSIRAFREMVMKYPDNPIVTNMAKIIKIKYPYFFHDIDFLPGNVSNLSVHFTVVNDDIHGIDKKRRHHAVAVRFIVNRAVTHELVRHRPCALLQESQRYCRYANDQFGNRVTFVKPMFFKEGSEAHKLWEKSILLAEATYLELLSMKTEDGKNISPQAARTVLPNSCKTEIIIYTSLEHWHHIFHMRAVNLAAEPSMREIMVPVHQEFIRLFPEMGFEKPLRMPEGHVGR